jgi:hypothetical protein
MWLIPERVVHLSTGDILRAGLRRVLSMGQFVKDEIVTDIFCARLSQETSFSEAGCLMSVLFRPLSSSKPHFRLPILGDRFIWTLH